MFEQEWVGLTLDLTNSTLQIYQLSTDLKMILLNFGSVQESAEMLISDELTWMNRHLWSIFEPRSLTGRGVIGL